MTNPVNKIDILLIYPPLGIFDGILRDIPLSLIYAAADSVKKGYSVKILDLRLYPNSWQQEIDHCIREGCSLIGISVMTGNPIRSSLAISKYIKKQTRIPIVWGGPHPTILPEQTLENENIDFIIRDWGSVSLSMLIQYVKDGTGEIADILGLGYKVDGKVVLNETQCWFEMLDFHDLPYHLVEITSRNYNRLNNGEVIFPIFTAVGCPYKCTFCMSPAVYKKIKGKKWIPYPIDAVIEHIDFVKKKYDFQRLQIYDDDSFVDIPRMRLFFEKYIEMGFHKTLKIDFRGVRINELYHMDTDFFSLMEKANVELMAIGVESGSARILSEMNKGITVDQILHVNRQLAKFPTIKPHYNFFCGVPGETYESLLETKDLILTLVKDNPHCYLGFGGDWKPLPGSIMTERAVKEYHLKLPDRLEDWAEIDNFDSIKISHPWYTPKMDSMIKLLQVAGHLLDKKVAEYSGDLGPVLGKMVNMLSVLYQPLLRLRLKYNITFFLIEYDAKTYFFRYLTKLLRIFKG
ncbi:MAG: radical SAM protein [Desulfobacteraceae bacterium]|nr:MAG: radical SAM protein [Desulfobacteraceae bacterium]